MREPFQVNTSGYCFICLQKQEPLSADTDNVEEPKENDYQEGQRPPHKQSFRYTSFKLIMRYLKIDTMKLANINFSSSFLPNLSSGDTLEDVGLMVCLCEQCKSLSEDFSQLFYDWEMIRLKLDQSVKLMMSNLAVGDLDENRVTRYELSVLRNRTPHGLFHSTLAETLREETKIKCSLRSEETLPRVKIKEEMSEIAIISTSSLAAPIKLENPAAQPSKTLIGYKIDSASSHQEDLYMTSETPVFTSKIFDVSSVKNENETIEFDEEKPVVVKLEPSMSSFQDYSGDGDTDLQYYTEEVSGYLDSESGNDGCVFNEEDGTVTIEHAPKDEHFDSSSDLLYPEVTLSSPTKVVEIRVYQCNLCPKYYQTDRQLNRHRRVKHNIHKHPIKKNKPKKSIPVKIKVNVANRKKTFWKCSVCKKQCPNKASLSVHMKVHTGNISCDFCGKLFTQEYNRDSHLYSVHVMEVFGEYLPAGTTKGMISKVLKDVIISGKIDDVFKSFCCPFCTKKSTQIFPMQTHVMKCHAGEITSRLQNVEYSQNQDGNEEEETDVFHDYFEEEIEVDQEELIGTNDHDQLIDPNIEVDPLMLG